MNGSRAATGAAVTTPMKERSWTRVSLASQRPGREWLPRAVYVVIVVLVTITLCYQLCVQFSVSPLIIRDFGMTFTSFVYISVVGNAIGAFASLAAGLADRWGRANLVMYGLLVTSVLVLVGLPNAPNKVTYLVLYAAVSLVEGMLLVATPALIRDFSPQLGRASAMGFWTLGPKIDGLVATEVSSNTLGSHPHWQTQYDRPARAGPGSQDCRCRPLGFLNGRAGGADH